MGRADGRDQTEDLKAIEVPTLVTQGDDYQIVPYTDAVLLQAKLIKNATLKVHLGYPHGVLTTHADVINPISWPSSRAEVSGPRRTIAVAPASWNRAERNPHGRDRTIFADIGITPRYLRWLPSHPL